jgi:hypothetical protein
MKTITKIIETVIIIICFCSACYSQQANLSASQELARHKRSINNTAYIFEGKVTQQECYYGKNKEILTCSVISINKIFRGSPQIKLGNIKVITKQFGRIGDNISHVNIDDKGVGLSKGSTYIIFGRPAYSYMLVDKMITTDDTITLTTMDCEDPIVFSEKISKNNNMVSSDSSSAQWSRKSHFNTLDELYSFLKENGLSVQEEVEQTTMPADTTKQQKQN